MASLCLEPPASFPFSRPDEWQHWKRRFEQFRLASGLSAEEDPRQVSALLYCMGDEAEDTLASTNISDDDRKNYSRVIAKFDAFFKIRKNIIFERARFNGRSQREGESVEQFITSQYNLAENCEYGGMKGEMIRDRIVVGIHDKALSEQLQLDAELTLEKAKKRVRQREAIQEQQVTLKGEATKQLRELPIDSLNYRKSAGKQTESTRHRKSPQGRSASNMKCYRCGKEPHARSLCPAKEAVCHTSKKKGHYSSQCFKKKSIGDVSTGAHNEQSQGYYDTLFLDTIDTGQKTMWNVTIQVEGNDVCFKLDTGAEVTVVGEKVLHSLNSKKLQTATKRLCGPDQTPLEKFL